MRRKLTVLLAELSRLKQGLLQASDAAEGALICALCGGACCRVGRYHPTALEVLTFLAQGDAPPEPDFDGGACPFLGASGCRIPPERRPFTCVIFICDRIDERLSDGDREHFIQLEGDLRALRITISEQFGRLLVEPFLLAITMAADNGVRILSR